MTATRIHIAIAVRDVEASVAFYRTLFGQAPTKLRDDYAKFEVADPPVNFTLNATESPHRPARPQHFGVQVKTTEAVEAALKRMAAANLELDVERSVTCCYAVQDKFWAVDPDGHHWEVFVVLHADAPVHSEPARETSQDEEPCCAPTCCQ